jgi:hypothetical protein
LTKQVGDAQAELAEAKRQIQIASLKQPENYDPVIAENLQYLLDKEKLSTPVVVAPPVVPPKEEPAANTDADKWFENVCEAVPGFSEWIAEPAFQSYLATKVGDNKVKWQTNPAWAATTVAQVRGEYQKAQDTAKAAEEKNKRLLSGSEVPTGGRGPAHESSPNEITQDQALELMMTDKDLKGLGLAEINQALAKRGIRVI